MFDLDFFLINQNDKFRSRYIKEKGGKVLIIEVYM